VALHASPSANPIYPGSPMYQKGVVAAQNRVAQLENIALWLVKDGGSPWLWVVPDDIKVSREDGVTFLEADRTWVAIRGLGTSGVKEDGALTKQLREAKKSRFPGHKVLSGKGTGSAKFCGFAIEVGEKESHGSFAKFKQAVAKAEVDLKELGEGVVRYKSSNGKWLGIHWNDNPLDLGVWRNGKRRDLKNAALYRSAVIESDWGSGTLRVNAGGEKFECSVDEKGLVKFQ